MDKATRERLKRQAEAERRAHKEMVNTKVGSAVEDSKPNEDHTHTVPVKLDKHAAAIELCKSHSEKTGTVSVMPIPEKGKIAVVYPDGSWEFKDAKVLQPSVAFPLCQACHLEKKSRSRLPDGATLMMAYDGKREVWVGSLMIGETTYNGEASGLFTLAQKLDAIYRASVKLIQPKPPEAS